MPNTIRVCQEGVIRTSGYQLSQWTARANTTAALQALFVVRKTVLGEKFERIADLKDFEDLSANEIKYFEAKKTGGNGFFDSVAGDILLLTPSIDYWVQTAAPYTNCSFVVEAVESTTGSNPQAVSGNMMRFPGYTMTADDVGRWVRITGFVAPYTAYNGDVQILGYTGDLAIVGKTIGANATSTGTYTFKRLRIQVELGATELRYFPTLVQDRGWSITRGGSPFSSGSYGFTQRQDPAVELFRSARMTTLEPTFDAALSRMSVVRQSVDALGRAADQNNTAFSTIILHDYPPVAP